MEDMEETYREDYYDWVKYLGSLDSPESFYNSWRRNEKELNDLLDNIQSELQSMSSKLGGYQNKYVMIQQDLTDNPNKYYIYILFINRVIPIENNNKVRVDSNQITVFCYINGYIDSANIYTKSPICNDELNIVVDPKEYKYTVKEITRTEYDDELFKALNSNVKYDE